MDSLKINKTSLSFLTNICIFGVILFLHLLVLANIIEIKQAIFILCIIFTLNSIWMLTNWYILTKEAFSFYILFLVAAILFNGGQILLEIFDLNLYNTFLSVFKGNFKDSIIYHSILYTTLGLIVFHMGAILSINNSPKNKTINSQNNDIIRESIFKVGLLLFLISVIPTLLIVKHLLDIVLAQGYMGIYQRELETGFKAIPMILMNYFSISLIFMLIGYQERKKFSYLLLLLMLVQVAILFFLGDRSGAILPFIAFLWVWHKVISPIPFKLLLPASLIILFILFPLISYTRILSGVYRLDLNFLYTAFMSIENPIISIISEMGASLTTLSYTMQLVPEVKNYEFGTSYFYAAYSIIPNFFSDIHPAKAHGSPSDWITISTFPHYYFRGGGLGYSFIAESYLNFGWVLGIAILGLQGYLIGKLDIFSKLSTKPQNIAFTASLMIFLLKYTRADMFSVFRPLVWYVFIPFSLIFIFMFLKRVNKIKN